MSENQLVAHGHTDCFVSSNYESILIAEGDDRVADLFAYLFARDGWTVTTCRDGLHAADALGGSATYDAVLLSNRLRDMGGVELIDGFACLTTARTLRS